MNFIVQSKKVVLLDLDGCIFDFVAGLGKLLWETKKVRGAYHQNTWGFEESYNIPEKDIWEWIDKTPGFWANLRECEPGALEHLFELEKQYPELSVIFITSRNISRNSNVKRETIECFQKHGYPSPRIIWDRNKGNWCASLGAVMLFDDKPENLDDALDKAHLVTTRYLCAQPYNQEYTNAIIVSGIHALFPYIEALFSQWTITTSAWTGEFQYTDVSQT